MRNKKKRSSNGAQCEGSERERPMSWEGELSDSEMVIDTVHNGMLYSMFHYSNKTNFQLQPFFNPHGITSQS